MSQQKFTKNVFSFQGIKAVKVLGLFVALGISLVLYVWLSTALTLTVPSFFCTECKQHCISWQQKRANGKDEHCPVNC